MSCNVAFIGLGVMGYPMAGYISKGGHNVTVFNRTKSKAEKWIKEYKGKMAETPAEAAKDAEYVFTCVGNDISFPTHVKTYSASFAASAGVSAILPLYSLIHFSAFDFVLLKTVTL